MKWQVVNATETFVEIFSTFTQSKENTSALKSSNKDSDSEEKGSEEDGEDEDKFDLKSFDRLFKGIN